MPFIDLINGYRTFFHGKFSDKSQKKTYQVNTQNPKAAFIACSDSRIDPAVITSAHQGDIFSIRNVASFVPPYNEGDAASYETKSSIEFAIQSLNISDIVVLGHSHCAAVNLAVNQMLNTSALSDFHFINDKINLLIHSAKEYISSAQNNHNIAGQKLVDHCSKFFIKESLNNMLTFPFIRDKIDNKVLKLHGWYFDIENGVLSEYDSTNDTFNAIC